MLLDQSPYLFQASVRENLAYGRSDATDAERGQTLSAESARIAIARAILANPKVLVLDEPTSALDEENERAIAETLLQIAEGHTAILITHGASLAKIAQQTITIPR